MWLCNLYYNKHRYVGVELVAYPQGIEINNGLPLNNCSATNEMLSVLEISAYLQSCLQMQAS